MDNVIIQEATNKFGLVIEAENNVLLIKRNGKGLFTKPNAKFMTIKAGINENGVSFHDGHYDMDLASATISFYSRSGSKTENYAISHGAKPYASFGNDLVQFPRLLSEIRANVEISDCDMKLLCESMDLNESDITYLFENAEIEWQRILKYL
jgi:hypothetical protein